MYKRTACCGTNGYTLCRGSCFISASGRARRSTDRPVRLYWQPPRPIAGGAYFHLWPEQAVLRDGPRCLGVLYQALTEGGQVVVASRSFLMHPTRVASLRCTLSVHARISALSFVSGSSPPRSVHMSLGDLQNLVPAMIEWCRGRETENGL